MIYRFKTKDCPDANGRQPLSGEQKWTAYFPAEDGGRVYIEMGEEGRAALLKMFDMEEADDTKDLRKAMAFIERMAEERHMLHGANPDRFWGCSRPCCKAASEFLRGTQPLNEGCESSKG